MNNARSFRSIFMVASCAGAALGCYMVSLRVASERAALEQVESRIVLAQRDIRTLQTEIGTRGRLAQLERWNVRVLALSAPSADQFLEGGFALAKLARPQETIEIEAPVVLASAPAPEPESALDTPEIGDDGNAVPGDARTMLRQASLKVRLKDEPAAAKAAPKAVAPKAPSQKPAATKTVDKKSTEKKEVAAAKPVTHAPRLAKADPLAPLPESKHGKTPVKSHGKTDKDSVATR